MEQETKKHILKVIADIKDSIELQEHQLQKRYKLLCSYIQSDDVKKLIDEFSVYTCNLEQEEHCQIVLHKILNAIEYEKEKINIQLKNLTYIEYPMWKDSLEILKEENCIVEYIKESAECFLGEDEGKNYLNKLTGKSLKEELLSYVDEVTQKEHFDFYNYFSEDDYNKAIEYAKIERNNEKIANIRYDLEEVSRFQVMFSLFDYDNVRNIYASSLIDLITAISEPIRSIIGEKYPDVRLRGDKLTSALINLRDRHPSCFCLNGKEQYVDIMESIERRNIYIHNGAIVNDKYLNFGNIIKSGDWNKQGYVEGDFLRIDAYYFEDVLEMIKVFISQL